MSKIWHLYLDTSVFGGAFEKSEGFEGDSRRVIDAIMNRKAQLLYSIVLEDELEDAPGRVRALFQQIPQENKTLIQLNNAVAELGMAYIAAGIVGWKSLDDALHVAAATVAGADAIVSWNFKHLVRLDRIKGYNEVHSCSVKNAANAISTGEYRGFPSCASFAGFPPARE